MTGLVVLGIVAVVYAVAAAKLDRVSVGAPIVFLLAGTALGSGVLGVLDLSPSSKPVELLTELPLPCSCSLTRRRSALRNSRATSRFRPGCS